MNILDNDLARARRDVLVKMLDRLGGDGPYCALSDMAEKQIADELYAHVMWLEARARCLALQGTFQAIDEASYQRFIKNTAAQMRADHAAEQRGEVAARETERRHEERLRAAIVAMVKR